MEKKISRREFLQKAGIATAGVVVGSSLLNNKSYAQVNNKSYGRIIGANDRVRVAYAGLNGRGTMLVDSFAAAGGVDILYICDPERGAREKGLKAAKDRGFSPTGLEDFRTILDTNKIDALAIAAPNHWHAPAAILAVTHGVHTYLEKPVSHNAAEGEILLAAMNKHKDVVITVGSQRRSVPFFQQIAQMAHEGVIGKIYRAKGWYVNNRPSNTFTKGAAVPDGLNWDLWQGPAPRVSYLDGVVPYNWHWTKRWGCGEANNNGPHEMDLMAWMTNAPFPSKVTTMGGKYQYQDSWEWPDMMQIMWECPDLMITWTAHSRNGSKIEGQGRGTWYYGTNGSMQLQDGLCNFYDPAGKLINTVKNEKKSLNDDPTNTATPGTYMDVLHANNFLNAIRGKDKLTVTPVEGHKAALYLHTGNISWEVGHSLVLDPKNGHIVGDQQAQALFGGTYEKGWEPKA